jgi:4-aminobutyrate aminotransferase-like enzyme
MELVQGEGGFNVGPREFLEPLMQECRERGIAVWADEVQTFGRTSEMFHFEQLGLGEYVDIATIGKMSQVCACLYTDSYNPQPGLLSGTFIGSTAGLRTGRRMLERMRDDGYYGADGRIEKLFIAFCEHARALVQKHPDWFPPVSHPDRISRVASGFFGGIGGMMRLTPFGGEKAAVIALLHRLYENGVIAFYCGHGPYHVRFLPPVGVLCPDDFGDIFAIIEASMAEVAGTLDSTHRPSS